MKQPVWILNSSLLVLLCTSQFFLFIMQRTVPRKISISPGELIVEQEQVAKPVNLAAIYEQDLFGTYERPVEKVVPIMQETVAAIPQPPKVIVPEIPVEKVPTFFAPLDVVLKGVIFVKDDPASCIAIVQLKKTKEEHNYQVGDLIEDAQILKILSNRIIIIRSNGQQETLYLREEDAVSDFNMQAKTAPKSVIEDAQDNKYTINIDEFTKRIHNLGQFINLLDLTTVYKQGKSFGCRVGKIDKDSLGSLLGFMIDDIIVKVDDYFVDDLDSRLKLYDHVIKKQVGDVINVVLYRGQDMITLMYGLVDNVSKSVVFAPAQTHEKLMEELQKHDPNLQPLSDGSLKMKLEEFQPIENLEKIEQEESPEKLNFDEVAPGTVPQYPDRPSQVIVQSVEDRQGSAVERHKNRLIQDHKKLQPTVNKMRTNDRRNMMRHSSKNAISGSMRS